MNVKQLNKMLNKDFYAELPESARSMLDELIFEYGDRDWFTHAFNEYREHVYSNTYPSMKMPGYIFNKYIGSDELSQSCVLDEMNEEEIFEIMGEYLEHEGVGHDDDPPGRGSGRYEYGSGANPFQHIKIDNINEYCKYLEKHYGLSETEIAISLGLSTTKLRAKRAIAADELRREKVAFCKQGQAEGKSNVQIAKEMEEKFNLPHSPTRESTVRSLLNGEREARMNSTLEAANSLKEVVDNTPSGVLDVGIGIEKELGISKDKMKVALEILQEWGYNIYGANMPQMTNKGQYTRLQLLAKPDVEQKASYQWDEIGHLTDYTSHDGGNTFQEVFQYPKSMSSERLMIKYAEDGGVDRDGLVKIRKGVKDLSLGESNYAQVRILVDDKYYIKGMAVYGEDKEFPDGVDVIFNSNKSKEDGMAGALKKIKKDDPKNPFGSAIKPGFGPHGGQSYYEDDDGNLQLSLINKRADEADWNDWSKELSAQMLSKQPKALIKRQLDLAITHKEVEYEDILEVSNPTVKKQLLTEFADGCDKAASDLKAAPFPNQKYQVILPVPSLKDDECYAPNYEDGSELALIRYPHGGTFEIPIVRVNNKNKEGISTITPNGKDAVGINWNVAQRLSGADFDGDTVMVIPLQPDKFKITSSDPLPGLLGFDPSLEYGPDPKQSWEEKRPNGETITHYLRNGVEYPLMHNTQTQMGIVSNLITDMTIKGATNEEKARAVRHSMVVIDAEKHHLDYRQSEIDNGIAELKKKYQRHWDEREQKMKGGAATLISRAGAEINVPERKEGAHFAKDTGNLLVKIDDKKNLYMDEQTGTIYRQNEQTTIKVDPKTGKKLYSETGKMYYQVEYKDTKNKKQTVRVYEKEDGLYYKNKETGLYTKVKDEKIITKYATKKSTQMAEVDDAMELVSDLTSIKEILYAQYANKLKAMANEARKEELVTKVIPYSPSAAKIYKKEVDELKVALDEAERNAPKERQAQMMANAQLKAYKQENPAMDNDTEMKIRTRLINDCRAKVGAKRSEIFISDAQFKAIQAGAIAPSRLDKMLKHCNKERLKTLATPRDNKQSLSRTQISRLKRMSSYGYTNEEVAKALGISVSTVLKYLGE